MLKTKVISILSLFTVLSIAGVYWVSVSQSSEGQEDIGYTYLTFSKPDTSTSITVHYYSDDMSEGQPEVAFDSVSRDGDYDAYEYRTYGISKKIKEVSRRISIVSLNDLEPAKTYYFMIHDGNGNYSKERKFRTLPAGEETIRFVQGGDMSTQLSMRDFLARGAERNPHFAMIGGDIAYANGQFKNVGKWDGWIGNWSAAMVTPDGHSVPIISAIGNHEINYLGLLTRNPNKAAPYWFRLFYQNTKPRTYFERFIGKHTVLYVLDSGHYTTQFGKQAEWLSKQMKKHREKPNHMALYHIPQYPSKRGYNEPASLINRLAWGEIFDRNAMDVAFENHDHTFKVTYPMKNGRVAREGEKGTVFVGDGCWGRSPRDIPNDRRGYISRRSSTPHLFYGEVKGYSIYLEGIGRDGVVFDRVQIYE